MRVKVVCFGDAHGDAVTEGVPRFDEVCAAMDFVGDLAIRECAGLVVFGGDLAESEGPGMLRTLEHAVRLATRLKAVRIESLWLTGNHDVIEDGHATSNLAPLRDVPGAELVDSPRLIKVGQDTGLSPEIVGKRLITVACLPFTPRTHDYDPELWVSSTDFDLEVKKQAKPDLVVGHLMLEGIGPGSETRDMPRGRNVFWPLEAIETYWPSAVLVGHHYHQQQVFRRVHLPGSLVRINRAEASNTPGVLLVTI